MSSIETGNLLTFDGSTLDNCYAPAATLARLCQSRSCDGKARTCTKMRHLLADLATVIKTWEGAFTPIKTKSVS